MAVKPPISEQRILIWMCLIIAINQIGFGALVPVLPLYAQSFGVSASAVGMTIGIYGLARFVIAMPTGRLADQLGRRPTLALGGLVSGVGNLWCALAGNFTEFMLARFAAGVGAGIVLTVGAVILADISTPARRGRMMSLYQGAFLFAVGIGPLPGGLLAEAFGLRMPFMFYAVAGLIAAFVVWFAIPETRDRSNNRRTDQSEPELPFMQQMRLLLRKPAFMLVSLVGFTQAVVRTGGLFSIVPVLAADQIGLSADRIGFGMALGILVGLLVAYPGGVVADKFGRKAVIVPATVLVGVSMASFCVAQTFGWYVASCLAWGAAASFSSAAPQAYAADAAPAGMNAAAISGFRMLSDVGYVVGPIGLGLMVDWRGASQSLLFAAAIVIVSGMLFARYAPETHRS